MGFLLQSVPAVHVVLLVHLVLVVHVLYMVVVSCVVCVASGSSARGSRRSHRNEGRVFQREDLPKQKRASWKTSLAVAIAQLLFERHYLSGDQEVRIRILRWFLEEVQGLCFAEFLGTVPTKKGS